MNDLDVNFVKRTQKIIKEYEGNLEYSLLINCTLGLILLPVEVNKQKKLSFLQHDINEIDIIRDIFNKDKRHIFNPTKYNKKEKNYEKASKNLMSFLYHLRNGLAHLANAEANNKDGEWISVRLKDTNRFNNNNVELEITIEKDDLKALAMFLSNEYIKEVDAINKGIS
jgi:hypothetical protein